MSTWTWIWIGLGLLAVSLLGAKGKPSAGKTTGNSTRIGHSHDINHNHEENEETATLIIHPHFEDDEDYKCSEYGKRFDKERRYCPKCGACFISTETDNTEYEDEEDDWYDEMDDDD